MSQHHYQDLDEGNIVELVETLTSPEFRGIVSEGEGGIIAYAFQDHAARIAQALDNDKYLSLLEAILTAAHDTKVDLVSTFRLGEESAELMRELTANKFKTATVIMPIAAGTPLAADGFVLSHTNDAWAGTYYVAVRAVMWDLLSDGLRTTVRGHMESEDDGLCSFTGSLVAFKDDVLVFADDIGIHLDKIRAISF